LCTVSIVDVFVKLDVLNSLLLVGVYGYTVRLLLDVALGHRQFVVAMGSVLLDILPVWHDLDGGIAGSNSLNILLG